MQSPGFGTDSQLTLPGYKNSVFDHHSFYTVRTVCTVYTALTADTVISTLPDKISLTLGLQDDFTNGASVFDIFMGGFHCVEIERFPDDHR